MKFAGLVMAFSALSVAPVMAEDLVNKKEFQVATSKAGDMGFNISLAQTARMLEFCGQKAKAQEVRDYLQPVTMVMANQLFKDVEAEDASKQNMRGMYLSRAIAASMATEIATVEALERISPLSDVQRKKVCDAADAGYAKVVDVKAKAKAADEADKAAAPAATK